MALSFQHDVLPLFDRQTDIPHMAALGVMLADYAYMSNPKNAQRVLKSVDGTMSPRMPPPPAAPWDPVKIDVLKQWLADGLQP